MNWKNSQVLVTGAAGFIGSHLVEHLMDLGAEVRAFVRYTSSGKIGNLEFIKNRENMEIFYGDLKDPYSVKKALKGVRFVFHLASLISIPYSYTNPREYFDNNITFILNILQGIEEEGVDFVVHTSTSEVYGTAQYVPIDEKHPLVGQSPYSASKIGADKVVESFYLSFNSPVAILRPFNTFGPRQTTRAIIPTIIIQLLRGGNVFLGDITTTRDFLYVKDSVRGFTKMVEKRSTIQGKTINIGTGREVEIETVARYLTDLINPKAEILLDKSKIRPKKSEVRQLCADITLAKECLDWIPKYDLKRGLEETVDWMKENIDYYSQTKSFK
ncbi:MAG: GDP-mannose 4,6-dehydratase [Candidatus Hermodarchaeota archaeon]